MKKVIIVGGSGFLGTIITEKLLVGNYEVVVVDLAPPVLKHKKLRFVAADITQTLPNNKNFKNPFAVINLAGKRIFGRWGKNFKDLIYKTRIDGTNNLVNLWTKDQFRPEVLVSASATGIYGDRGADDLDESSSVGSTFLSMVASDWEKAAWQANQLGVRTCLLRNGHIISSKGGLLKVVLPLYRLGLGGELASGRQFFPWISLEDAASAYVRAIEDTSWVGCINLVAPQPVTNREFSEILAVCLKRPSLLHVPKFALKLLFGDFAKEIVASQKVYPRRLLQLGFDWKDRKLNFFLQKELLKTK